MSLLVRRWVMDLSWMCSLHWEKVCFSPGVRKSSSQPSVVRFWSGMEWKELLEGIELMEVELVVLVPFMLFLLLVLMMTL